MLGCIYITGIPEQQRQDQNYWRHYNPLWRPFQLFLFLIRELCSASVNCSSLLNMYSNLAKHSEARFCLALLPLFPCVWQRDSLVHSISFPRRLPRDRLTALTTETGCS